MDMRIVKTGQDRPFPCIDDSCFRASQRADLLVAADRHQTMAKDGESLSTRLGRVHGVDGTVNKDGIGSDQS